MSGIVTCSGFFTTLRFLQGRSAPDLERAVGFGQGRLASGFKLVVLAEDETIAPGELSLKASSRWSAGLVKSASSGEGKEITDLLLARGQDPDQLKQSVLDFFSRRGLHTPAKILPNLRHTPAMQYPDAEALGPGIRSGIPQFELLVAKRFVIVHSAPSARTSPATCSQQEER